MRESCPRLALSERDPGAEWLVRESALLACEAGRLFVLACIKTNKAGRPPFFPGAASRRERFGFLNFVNRLFLKCCCRFFEHLQLGAMHVSLEIKCVEEASLHAQPHAKHTQIVKLASWHQARPM